MSILLRPGQKEVVAYREGKLAVPAVPGAGKTTCLSYLGAELIEKVLKPRQKILIVTVMNSAVANFKSRICGILESKELPNKGYEVKTLHSLAVMILKEKPEAVMVNEAFEIIDEGTRSQILNKVVSNWIIRNKSRWMNTKFIDNNMDDKKIDKWQDAIEKMAESLIKHIKLQGYSNSEWQKILERLSRGPDCFLKWAVEIMDQYSIELKNQGLVDFDDLIVYAYQLLLEDNELRVRLQNRWTYIFEDEAQDSTPLQEKILKLLSGNKGNLVRVGDCNQGIMGFSGTDSELFNHFCATVEKQPILEASRSSIDIIEIANHLVTWVRNEYPQEECRDALVENLIIPVSEDDPNPNPITDYYGVIFHEIDGNLDVEIQYLVTKLTGVLEKYPDKTIGVLLKNNKSVETFLSYLKQNNISCDDVTASSLGETDGLKNLKIILRFIAVPFEKEYFIQTLTVLLDDLEEYELSLVHELADKLTPEEILYPIGGEIEWSIVPDELLTSPAWTKVKEVFNILRKWLELSNLKPDEMVLYLAGELKLTGDEKELTNNYALQVSKIINEFPNNGLIEIIDQDQRLTDSLKLMQKTLIENRGYQPHPGVVAVSTMHKSKGLEWDIVYVVGLGRDIIPLNIEDYFHGFVKFANEKYSNPTIAARAQLAYFANSNGIRLERAIKQSKIEEIKENIRLVYVAITRAKETLIISTHTKDRFDKKVKPNIVFNELKRFAEVRKNDKKAQ